MRWRTEFTRPLAVLMAAAALACAPSPAGGADGPWSHALHTWTGEGVGASGVCRAEPFTELLASWHVEGAPDAPARLEVRVGDARGWTPWLTVAEHGPGLAALPAQRKHGPVRVDVDVLLSERPMTHAGWRVLVPAGSDARVRGVWLTTTARAPEADPRGGPAPASRVWDVPFVAQREAGEALGGRVCGPASTAMVMRAHGVERPLAQVAAAAYDPAFGIYGNWIRNTAATSREGVPLIATRLESWSALAAALERGPVVISLPPFDAESLPEAGYASVNGHLLVVRGLDGAGGVLVSDPAHRSREAGERVYPVDRLTRLWLGRKRGTAYVSPAAW